MKRDIFLLVMLLCLTVLCSGCKNNEAEAAGVSSAASTAEKFCSSAKAEGAKLVFHDTIDDPQGEYMDSLGSGSGTSGTASLDMVLYESAPDKFEGYGVMRRSIEMAQGEAGGSTQKYTYRTGHIIAEAGKDGNVDLTGWLTYDSRIPAMQLDAPFNVETHKDATLRHEGLPLHLTLSGKQASLSIKLHDYAELVFSGELTSEPVESPVAKPSNMEELIYINSLWSGSFSGEIGIEEYTAVLLASPKAGTYSGQFSIDGKGNAFEVVGEEITFSFVPFDAVEYQNAGGHLEDCFTAMSILNVKSGTYILLLDGEQVILEAVDKEVCFGGRMLPQTSLNFLQNEAEKTREMLLCLYRQKGEEESSMPDYSGLKDLDPQKPEDLKKLMEMSEQMNTLLSHQTSPAWYPENLIPMVNFSADDGFLTIPAPDKLLFPIYNTVYSEMEDLKDLVEPYRTVLSAYDNYQEYQDYDLNEAVFIFTMGKYTVQVFMSQSVVKLTSISVQIY